MTGRPNQAERAKLLEKVAEPRWTGRRFEQPSSEALAAAKALNDLPLPIGTRWWSTFGEFNGGLCIVLYGGVGRPGPGTLPLTVMVSISGEGGYRVLFQTEKPSGGSYTTKVECAAAVEVFAAVSTFLYLGTPSCFRCEFLLHPDERGAGNKFRCRKTKKHKHAMFPFAATKCAEFSARADDIEKLEAWLHNRTS